MYVGNVTRGRLWTIEFLNLIYLVLLILLEVIVLQLQKISDRTGMALAQIEIAKRTIDHSTDTALNRLKWIRRNKDEQNLTNLNIDFNFTNQKLASLTEVVKTSAAKKKTKDKEEDVFYWSEGSISIGRIGDTSISSTKKIGTNAITFGADRFTDENGIKGLAFRLGEIMLMLEMLEVI